jgi:hypothetical protein
LRGEMYQRVLLDSDQTFCSSTSMLLHVHAARLQIPMINGANLITQARWVSPRHLIGIFLLRHKLSKYLQWTRAIAQGMDRVSQLPEYASTGSPEVSTRPRLLWLES